MIGKTKGPMVTLLLAATLWSVAESGNDVPEYGYTIKNAFPHDPFAFTQGLVYRDGALYESTGLEGRSSLRRVDLASGRIWSIGPYAGGGQGA